MHVLIDGKTEMSVATVASHISMYRLPRLAIHYLYPSGFYSDYSLLTQFLCTFSVLAGLLSLGLRFGFVNKRSSLQNATLGRRTYLAIIT
jgi:hypothetical protein